MPPEAGAISYRQSVDVFAAALVDPSLAVPPQTQGLDAAPDGRRFAVYRNNVALSLIGVLAARYPATRRLVGEEFFSAMARAYAQREKPTSPVMIHYGASFPAFIAGFEPARELAYLSGVAMLENAWMEAYHAAEAEPAGLDALAGYNAERLAGARVAFHPAARLLRADEPVASIWAAQQGQAERAPPQDWRAEEVLVTRPHADVLVRILPRGGYVFARALQDGATLAQAHGATGIADFDAGAHLIGLIEAGAVVALRDNAAG